jgi:hypothetical protein
MARHSRDLQGCALLLLFGLGVTIVITLPGFLFCHFALTMEFMPSLLIGFLVGNFVIGLLEIIPFPFKLLRRIRRMFSAQDK